MYRLLRQILPAVAWLVLPLCALAQTTAAEQPVCVTFLHVNDSHGRTEPYNINGESVGGYARLATALQEVRAERSADRIFLIHAGDEFSRCDGLTTASRGAANVALFNQLGFDLWVPGNGEFYGGLAVLNQRFSEFKGQTLSANLAARIDGKLLTSPYVIHEVRGFRIAFLGLCFIHEKHPACLMLKMEDPVQTATRLVPELRKKADFVVVVSHIGLQADQKLAQSVNGIDLIIGAHSHTVLPNGAATKSPDGKTVVIAQAGEFLNYLGRVDLEVARTPGGWEIQTLAPTLRKLDQKVQIDPTVQAAIARLAATTQPATRAPVPAGR